VLTFKRSSLGCCLRSTRTVREEAFSQQFVVFFTCSCVLFVRFILLVDSCCTVFADDPF
jgi:hypothetical protein